ncbi:MAG: hypothetical protein Q4G34_00245 [Micrococcus sp.]|nr:hypothetical protein [Micrococcus sp.]
MTGLSHFFARVQLAIRLACSLDTEALTVVELARAVALDPHSDGYPVSGDMLARERHVKTHREGARP